MHKTALSGREILSGKQKYMCVWAKIPALRVESNLTEKQRVQTKFWNDLFNALYVDELFASLNQKLPTLIKSEP